MPNNKEELDVLLTKLGKPTISQIEARRQGSDRFDWAIIVSGVAGLLLALNGSATGIFLLLGAAVGFVVHSREREASFMSLVFLMAMATVVLGAVGHVFDIPWLTFGPGGQSRGMTGGWEY